MKYIPTIFSAVILFISCDPRSSKDLYQQGSMMINVNILNPRDSVNLGDSICFVFDVPDTILINSNKYSPTYEVNDGISITLNDCKMDTSLGGEWRSYTPDCDTYANPGTLQPDFSLAKLSNRKLYGKFFLIPKSRGVYFLQNQQAGYFSINNQGLKGRVFIKFDVPDKHHDLLLNKARAQNKVSFQAFLQNSENVNLPIYGFVVK